MCVCVCRGCSLSEEGVVVRSSHALDRELQELSVEERRLDELIHTATCSVSLLTEDRLNKSYPSPRKPCYSC